MAAPVFLLTAAASLAAVPGDSVAMPASGDPRDRERAISCLAAAIAYEAAFEPVEGQKAVAEVVLNRVRHPAFGDSVCGVVFAGSERRTGCQFSFTCDGSLRRRLPDLVMARSRQLAAEALDGKHLPATDGATHYHAAYVSPYWAPSLVRLRRIGLHIFYRNPGPSGLVRSNLAFRPVGEPVIPAIHQGWLSASAPAAVPGPTRPASPGATETAAAAGFAPWGLAITP